MNQVHIDVIRREPAQTLVRRSENVMTRQALMDKGIAAAETHLGRDHDIFSTIAKSFRKHLFGLAGGVDVGRIEMIDAGIECLRNELCRKLLVNFGDCGERGAFRRSERHRAECEARHNQPAIAETRVLHGASFLRERKAEAATAIFRLSCVEVQVGNRNLRGDVLIEHP
jgi:hypothetical protein